MGNRVLNILKNVVAICLVLYSCERAKKPVNEIIAPNSWIDATEKIIPLSDDLINHGKETYTNYCQLCHGPAGDGDGKVAKHMTTKPRNFKYGKFKFKTTSPGNPPKPIDIFRTITNGIQHYGMPSFYHLSIEERWGLVYYIMSLDTTNRNFSAYESYQSSTDQMNNQSNIQEGEKLFDEFGCRKCHFEKQELVESSVEDMDDFWDDDEDDQNLMDDWGRITFPTDFTKGSKTFKTGNTPEDIYRVLVTGVEGTPMPSFQGVSENDEMSLWSIALYLSDYIKNVDHNIKTRWEEIYIAQFENHESNTIIETPEENNWSTNNSNNYKISHNPEKSCLGCHEGIEEINDTMHDYIFALGGSHEGRSCVVCHEGNPDASKKDDAHLNMFPNPGAMWVVSTGKGCGKCHSGRNDLKTLKTHQMPHPTGGELMEVVSTATDPSGLSGSNHVYRMQRGLMATEFGKASHTLMSNGVVPKGDYKFADYHMDDPDGLVPMVGTEDYKEFIRKSILEKFIKPADSSQSIPTFDKGMKLWNDEVKSAFSDYYRKECGRCHVWEEGRRKRGDLRAGGCSACHVLYTNDGIYEGNDPTIPKDKPIHPMKHEITLKIPATQCNHCHTRGKRIGTTYVGAFEFDYKTDGKAPPWDEEGNAQDLLYTKDYLKVREDVHFERGMQCIDCHTSIDVHGDGNLYPTTLYQVEIQCADCHGTPEKYPWELPVGFGTPVTLDGERGLFNTDTASYLLTSRGNPRSNLIKNGDQAVLTSYYDGTKHDIPLLKEKQIHNTWKTEQGKVAMSIVNQHIDKLECYSCHSTWAPQCYGCHTKYDRRELATDWVMTGAHHDPHTGKQNIVKTPGKVTIENRSFLRWEDPMLGINLKGKVSPVIPGCQVFFTYVDSAGNIHDLNKAYKLEDGTFNPTMAPVQPHANSIPARTCESCHTNPKTIGYGTSNSRSVGKIDGDRPMFQNLAEGLYGDIPGSETAKWQVPKIPDYPYALDQLVTRSGKQVQNMPHVEDRPLNKEERDKVEREGVCIACHKHYNTDDWDKIRIKLKKDLGLPEGYALTPEQHDKAVEHALKSLIK